MQSAPPLVATERPDRASIRAAYEHLDATHKGKWAGQWSRGTGSLPASVDIVLEMHPFRAADVAQPDWATDRCRWLLAHSHHEETPRRLLIEWNPDGADYRVLADPPDEDIERGWSAICLVLSDFEDPQTASEILRNWPPRLPAPQPRHAPPLARPGGRTPVGGL